MRGSLCASASMFAIACSSTPTTSDLTGPPVVPAQGAESPEVRELSKPVDPPPSDPPKAAPTSPPEAKSPAPPPDDAAAAPKLHFDEDAVLARAKVAKTGSEFVLVRSPDSPEEPNADDEFPLTAFLAFRPDRRAPAFVWREVGLDGYADEFSLHAVRVIESPTMFDVRINTHWGEDNWSTNVEAWLLQSNGSESVPTEIWAGTERYEGVLDICLTVDGHHFEAEANPLAVWLVHGTEQVYSPTDPEDHERVPKSDCPPQKRKETRTKIWPAP